MNPPADRLGRRFRDLRISVTDRCNFRCLYCMPAEVFGERYHFLPRREVLSFEEIERVTRITVSLGARKLRVTGGEPLVRAELPKLIARLAAIEEVEDLTLTTNGYLLEHQASALRQAGLQRITVSLDSHDDEVFRRMNGRGVGAERVLSGIEAAAKAGLRPIKINCVVQRGVNDGEIVSMARYFRKTGHVLRFIEYMDVGTRNGWDLSQVVSAREIVESIDAVLPLEPLACSYRGEVARRYRYRDGSGEIGVIASVTQPFCRDCTRARLSADGRLVTCLFATGGTHLKTLLRSGASDAELRDVIAGIWSRRADRYSEERTAHTGRYASDGGPAKIEMHEIGG
jgi:cyclic pyranopterin phosphate synthase